MFSLVNITNVLALATVLLATKIIYHRHFHSLSKVPGPFLASFSRLWLLYHALSGTPHLAHVAAHHKYGPIVRVGPNHILLSDPKHGPMYYSWDKSDWWLCFRPNDKNLAFSTELSKEVHNAKKKRVAQAYSMTSLRANEKTMDARIAELLDKFAGFADRGETVDVASWMSYINLDILMDMVFSTPTGCVKEGTDAKGLVAANRVFVAMANVIGIYPFLYRIMQLPFIARFGPQPTDETGGGLLFGIAERSVKARLEKSATKKSNSVNKPADILQSLVNYRSSDEQRIPQLDLQNEAIVAMASGADTVSCTLCLAVLHLATNATVHSKLLAEIDSAATAGNLSDPPQFDETRKLEYLDAVIQELIRVHPVMASPFWRASPATGVVIENHYIPPNTHVGINEWIVAYNKELYGADPDVFRPERWLECSEETKRRRQQADLLFGHGDYSCAGRNFALLELQKLLVQLCRYFVFVPNTPEKPWTSRATISFTHDDFFCRIYRRESVVRA